METRRVWLGWLGGVGMAIACGALLRAAEPSDGELAEHPELPVLAEDDGVRVAVLGYHDFSETQRETAMCIRTSKFRRQMELLKQMGIEVVTLEDFIAWKEGRGTLPEKSVLITLDDGWKSVYTDAYPILKELGYPFTLYLYKNYVDGGGRALSSAMVQEMLANGASIGSHSTSHPFPAAVKKEQAKGAEDYGKFLKREFGDSKEFLEGRFGVELTTYAYPGGFHTEEMLPLAKDLGYRHLFTVQPGKVGINTDDAKLPRYMILGNHDPIFEVATTFREASQATIHASGAVSGLMQETAFPVEPMAGAIENSRLPRISADLATLVDMDPTSLTMQVSGFGTVPAEWNAETRVLSWRVNRPIRHLITQVVVSWKDSAGKSPELPLRWSFQIDKVSAYFSTAK